MSSAETRSRADHRHAVQACRDAGMIVVDPESCTCDLHGQLVVVNRPEGLQVLWPYDEPCPVHCPEAPAKVPERAIKLAEQLDVMFAQDSELVRRLNAAQHGLQSANDRLWSGRHPDGLATVYGEHPAAVEVAVAEHRSEVLSAVDPLGAVQEVHWRVHRAFLTYQTAAEERRQLAGDIGETSRQFVDALVAIGWSEEQARNTNVHELATSDPASERRN